MDRDYGKHVIYAALMALPLWNIWQAGDTHILYLEEGTVSSASQPGLFTLVLALELFWIVMVACAWLPDIIRDARNTDIRDFFR